MIAYEFPYERPSVWADLRQWLWLCAQCWLAVILVGTYLAVCYWSLFLAIQWAV